MPMPQQSAMKFPQSVLQSPAERPMPSVLQPMPTAGMPTMGMPTAGGIDVAGAGGPGQGGAATEMAATAQMPQQVPGNGMEQQPAASLMQSSQQQPQQQTQLQQPPMPQQAAPQMPPAGFVPNAMGQQLYPPGQGPITGQVPKMAGLGSAIVDAGKGFLKGLRGPAAKELAEGVGKGVAKDVESGALKWGRRAGAIPRVVGGTAVHAGIGGVGGYGLGAAADAAQAKFYPNMPDMRWRDKGMYAGAGLGTAKYLGPKVFKPTETSGLGKVQQGLGRAYRKVGGPYLVPAGAMTASANGWGYVMTQQQLAQDYASLAAADPDPQIRARAAKLLKQTQAQGGPAATLQNEALNPPPPGPVERGFGAVVEGVGGLLDKGKRYVKGMVGRQVQGVVDEQAAKVADVTQRYVEGKMTPAELQQFKQQYPKLASNPKLQQARQLQLALQKNAPQLGKLARAMGVEILRPDESLDMAKIPEFLDKASHHPMLAAAGGGPVQMLQQTWSSFQKMPTMGKVLIGAAVLSLVGGFGTGRGGLGLAGGALLAGAAIWGPQLWSKLFASLGGPGDKQQAAAQPAANTQQQVTTPVPAPAV